MTKGYIDDEAAPSPILRELGVFERLYYLVAKRTDTHFCLVAEVHGRLDTVALQAACEHVRRRHPMLSARIAPGPRGAPTAYQSDEPVEVRVFDATSADWTALVTDEVARPFPPERGPMFRVNVLRAEDKAALVFTFVHTLIDARSGVQVIRDVLAHMARKPLGIKSIPDALEDFVTRNIGALPGEAAAPRGQGQAGPLATDDPPPRWRPRFSTLSLSRSETDQILRACRQAKCTLHGALCAGLASTSYRGGSAEDFRVCNSVDFRAVVSAPDDICTFLVSAAPVTFAAGPKSDFWSRARQASRELATVRRPEAVLEQVAMIQSAVPPDISSDEAHSALKAAVNGDVFVTNIGAVKMEKTVGALTVHKIWGPMSDPSSYDVPIFCVSGFDGAVQIVEMASADSPLVLEELKSVLLIQSAPVQWGFGEEAKAR